MTEKRTLTTAGQTQIYKWIDLMLLREIFTHAQFKPCIENLCTLLFFVHVHMYTCTHLFSFRDIWRTWVLLLMKCSISTRTSYTSSLAMHVNIKWHNAQLYNEVMHVCMVLNAKRRGLWLWNALHGGSVLWRFVHLHVHVWIKLDCFKIIFNTKTYIKMPSLTYIQDTNVHV